MNILAFTRQNSAVGYHRIMLPMHYMANRFVRLTDTLKDELFDRHFDIVLINRYIDGHSLEELLDYKKRYGFKLIVDIDDYWHLDPWHILYGNYPTASIMQHIKAADGVTVTNYKLRSAITDELGIHEKKICILPNALPYGHDQFTDAREDSTDKTRFVYVGGNTHLSDVKHIGGAMKRIQSDGNIRNSSQFILSGYQDHPVWISMLTYFSGGYKGNVIVQPGLPVSEYMNLYNSADVAMAPLKASRFNSMKSNLKVLEAAAKKIPIICSDLPPYSICPDIVHAANSSDWYFAIKKLAKDAIYRQELGMANYEWCKLHHSIWSVNEDRRQFYEYIKDL